MILCTVYINKLICLFAINLLNKYSVNYKLQSTYCNSIIIFIDFISHSSCILRLPAIVKIETIENRKVFYLILSEANYNFL